MCLPQRKHDYRREQSTIARTNILSDKESPVADRLDAQLSEKKSVAEVACRWAAALPRTQQLLTTERYRPLFDRS